MFTKHTLPAASLWLSLTLSTFAAIHEQLATIPLGWKQVGAPAENDTMILQIALAQQNLDQLDAKIMAVSTPGSASYGQYMDGDAVAAMLAPSADASPAVLAWLKGAGVTNAYSDGANVNFSTTVNLANSLLSTTFSYYENAGIQKLRTIGYSVPDDLQTHIDLITPTTYFGKTVPQIPVPKMVPRVGKLSPRYFNGSTNSTTNDTIDASCVTLITPTCLKELYNINYTPDPKSGSKIGFGSFLNQSARTQDLSLFQTAQDIPQQGFSVQLINGGINDQAIDDNHGEADLDVEYISGISHPLPIISFITGGSPPFIPNLDEPTAADNENEPYLNYYQYLLSQPNSALPNVITNSYGDDEQTVPEKYAKRVCYMIGQLGLRGISVLESAGDTGVGAPCQSNDGKKTPQFTPQFPGTCPYITAVGGTQSIEPEIAWVAGSGGFSNYFPRPEYQAAAVSTYLNDHISAATKDYFSAFTNFANRGFPDVSAHSLTPDYAVVVNAAADLSGGTSAAAPVFSSVIALLNDARFRAGKPPLGFLNPWLYAIGFTGLTDITGGQSVGCNGIDGQTGAPVPGGSIIPYASWNATEGWDPVTGLGVPNFEKLLALALNF
ncbi:hypothetical protein HO173_008681 [Letharia columbiana]|uniref:tripeptidyl-peptidase II n=1 Tax=Letharia columbiana TaxID=112416 RepID=A0A8H6FR33_9LECA|nr:uncharacterized protein HO173_008681 [Letharia columbiana]KAF6233137.1 hypothetical protein HO173_008681 [Letharia columbiana]